MIVHSLQHHVGLKTSVVVTFAVMPGRYERAAEPFLLPSGQTSESQDYRQQGQTISTPIILNDIRTQP